MATNAIPLTPEQFRADFPAFADTTKFPDAMVNFYIILITNLMENAISRWGDLYSQGQELYVAHNCALSAKAALDAAAGGIPGLARGVIASEGAGPVSVGYDTNLAGEQGAGFYNLTWYGQQFIRLAKLIGMGGLQLNVGCVPCGQEGLMSYNAWTGPVVACGLSD